MNASDVEGKENCRLEKYSGEGFGRFLRDAGARRPWIDEFGGQTYCSETRQADSRLIAIPMEATVGVCGQT